MFSDRDGEILDKKRAKMLSMCSEEQLPISHLKLWSTLLKAMNAPLQYSSRKTVSLVFQSVI